MGDTIGFWMNVLSFFMEVLIAVGLTVLGIYLSNKFERESNELQRRTGESLAQIQAIAQSTQQAIDRLLTRAMVDRSHDMDRAFNLISMSWPEAQRTIAQELAAKYEAELKERLDSTQRLRRQLDSNPQQGFEKLATTFDQNVIPKHELGFGGVLLA